MLSRKATSWYHFPIPGNNCVQNNVWSLHIDHCMWQFYAHCFQDAITHIVLCIDAIHICSKLLMHSFVPCDDLHASFTNLLLCSKIAMHEPALIVLYFTASGPRFWACADNFNLGNWDLFSMSSFLQLRYVGHCTIHRSSWCTGNVTDCASLRSWFFMLSAEYHRRKGIYLPWPAIFPVLPIFYCNGQSQQGKLPSWHAPTKQRSSFLVWTGIWPSF